MPPKRVHITTMELSPRCDGFKVSTEKDKLIFPHLSTPSI